MLIKNYFIIIIIIIKRKTVVASSGIGSLENTMKKKAVAFEMLEKYISLTAKSALLFFWTGFAVREIYFYNISKATAFFFTVFSKLPMPEEATTVFL